VLVTGGDVLVTVVVVPGRVEVEVTVEVCVTVWVLVTGGGVLVTVVVLVVVVPGRVEVEVTVDMEVTVCVLVTVTVVVEGGAKLEVLVVELETSFHRMVPWESEERAPPTTISLSGSSAFCALPCRPQAEP
jgi:hypothetical protein